jgi:hypothetical protein
MRAWRALPDERWELYSPIGIELVDDLTGKPPIGAVRVHLDRAEGAGWIPTTIRAVFTPSGLVAYPGLGRTREPADQPVRRYRARVEAELYRPRYAPSEDGVIFDVHPYNDANKPADAGTVKRLPLAPAPHYPFPLHLRLLHGVVVVESNGKPVVDALVEAPGAKSVLSNELGAFSLPLTQAKAAGTIDVIATARDGAVGRARATLPDALGKCLTLLIS